MIRSNIARAYDAIEYSVFGSPAEAASAFAACCAYPAHAERGEIRVDTPAGVAVVYLAGNGRDAFHLDGMDTRGLTAALS